MELECIWNKEAKDREGNGFFFQWAYSQILGRFSLNLDIMISARLQSESSTWAREEQAEGLKKTIISLQPLSNSDVKFEAHNFMHDIYCSLWNNKSLHW